MSKLSEAQNIYRTKGAVRLIKRSTNFVWRTVRDRAYRIQHTTIGRPVLTMTTPAGAISFEVNPNWPRLPEIAAGGTYEPFLLETLHATLEPEDIFYNVGARWGMLSLFARQCGVRPDRIASFEADSNAVDILERNLENPMQTFAGAIGTGDGDTVALDDHVESRDRSPTIIKIDVEGHEADVLRGATSILQQQQPTLYVELHPQKLRPEDNQTAVIRLLREFGYELTVSIEHREDSAGWTPLDDTPLPETGDYLLRARCQ